jgi:hypothetical protein
MAFGLWKKIKNGVKKVVGGIGKAASWVNDKVFKPIIRPLAPAIGAIANTIVPGSGLAITSGIGTIGELTDKFLPHLKKFSEDG